ncbi:MAG: hypothetical protein R2815_09350 [Flavobacteriales bacterium]
MGPPEGDLRRKLALIRCTGRLEPGEDYAYCNTNYLLLDRIMEKTLGHETSSSSRNASSTRSTSNAPSLRSKDVAIADVMSGFHQGHPADLKTDDIGMVATAQDVAVFLRALNTGELLTDKERGIYASIKSSSIRAGCLVTSFALYHADGMRSS